MTDTIRIRSATSRRVIQRTSWSTGRGWFNLHLVRHFLFLQTREYPLPGIEISEYRLITIPGVGRGVAPQRGSLIFLYEAEGLWRRFDLARTCLEDQVVESYDETRRERDF